MHDQMFPYSESAVNAWHNAGSAKALTTSFVDGDWIDTGEATEAMVRVVVSSSVGGPTYTDVEIEYREDSSDSTFKTIVEESVSAGVVSIEDRIVRIDGGDRNYAFPIAVPPDSQIRVNLKRVGGTSADALATVVLVHP